MAEYRRYQGRSYMIWSENVTTKGYEYPMLTSNRIPGLLSLDITNGDGKTQFWYDISSMHSLENWAGIRKLGGAFLREFFRALIDTLEQVGGYLLEEDGVSLVPERIFVDGKGKEILFCYMPWEKVDFTSALRGFMEYFLSHMEHGNGEEMQKCYAVYEKCQEDHVVLEDLMQILFAGTEVKEILQTEVRTKEREEVTPVLKENDAQDRQRKGVEKSWDGLLDHVKQWKGSLKKKEEMETSYVFEPEEHIQAPLNPTVFLGSENSKILGELRYEGDGREENLKIETPVYLIGNQKEEVDGVVRDETVSRIHARITVEEGTYYLEDMNSTNGTYRNGEMLNYMEKVPLVKNDKITFAKETYRFI